MIIMMKTSLSEYVSFLTCNAFSSSIRTSDLAMMNYEFHQHALCIAYDIKISFRFSYVSFLYYYMLPSCGDVRPVFVVFPLILLAYPSS